MSSPTTDKPAERVPRHIAVIMDGNGRWAEARGLSRNQGHRAGLDSLREVVESAMDLGVEFLTVYAFSIENWNRPKAEVDELMRLLQFYLDNEIEEVVRKGVRVCAMGRLDRLTERCRQSIAEVSERTKNARGMTVCFAISYGGRTEIVDATRRMLRDAELGKLDPEAVDEKTFSAYLYQPELPDPDLLIRTGAESRVSNFLLWQIAYTEFYSTDVMWPDFRRAHLVEALEVYRSRERRFGLTSEQVGGGRCGGSVS